MTFKFGDNFKHLWGGVAMGGVGRGGNGTLLELSKKEKKRMGHYSIIVIYMTLVECVRV